MTSAPGAFHPQQAADVSPITHIDLEDEWRAEDEPRAEDKWCPVCGWDGSWQNLLCRSQEAENQGTDEVPWVWCLTRPGYRSLLGSSARRGNLCCAAALAFSIARCGNISLVGMGKGYHADGTRVPFINEASFGGYKGSSGRLARPLFALKEDGGDEPLPPNMTSLSMDLYRSVQEASGMCSRDSSLAWAKKRIDACVANHPKCGVSHNGFLPTRLLLVPFDAEEAGVCLRHRESVPRDTRYAALSHCWGPETSWPKCRTTADNYSQQLLGIPWAALPRTFANAITATRRLGLEYIWIDSLCIVQQDEADWKLESVTMHQVYSNAYVTLAAAESSDSHGGFWLGQSYNWKMPERLMTFTWRGKKFLLLLFSEPAHRTWHVVHGARFDRYGTPPLLSRAWAFQERIVSPRTLFFGKGGIMWDCFTNNEVQQDLFSELLHVASSPCYGPKQHFADYSTASASLGSFHLWHHIVSQYTDLCLSVATDRLPAIAAVAQRIHTSRPGDEYICGLWRSSLAHDLLWQPKPHIHIQNNQTPALLPAKNEVLISGHEDEAQEDFFMSPYIGPSWSWASSFGSVIFRAQDIATTKLELLGTRIKFQDGNRFGRVSQGSHLIVRVLTLPCRWKPNRPSADGPRKLKLLKSRRQSIRDVYFRLDSDFQMWRGWDREAETDALLALVGLTESGQARALVLHHFGDTKTYRRIGILRHSDIFDEGCKLLSQTFEEDGQVQTIFLS